MSVWSRSKPLEHYIIFSIDNEQSKLVRETFETLLAEKQISFKPIEGCYKGTKEHSYIVNGKHFKELLSLSGYWKNQESFLLLGRFNSLSQRKAHLLNLNTMELIDLGWCKEVTKEEALKHDNYSYREDVEKYWICEETYS